MEFVAILASSLSRRIMVTVGTGSAPMVTMSREDSYFYSFLLSFLYSK